MAMSQSNSSTATPSPKSSAPSLAEPIAPPTTNVLRPKLTFVTALNKDRPKLHPPQLNQRRMTSPPPPSTYESRVSFDTFDNRDATDFAFTLVSKHKHYAYTPRSRTFLCGTDQNDYSEFALEWLVDELVEDGDEIVCLRVVDKDSKIASDASLQEGKYKVEARKLLEHIQKKNKNDEKSISLILEFAVGKVPETIQRMINIYSPACLIVGTRGRSLGGIQGLLPGSVSKYCLQNSPVPVVVVRPSDKRGKGRAKRKQNSKGKSYNEIFENVGAYPSHMLDKAEREKLVAQSGGIATEWEAKAVADAIGLNEEIGVFAKFRNDPSADGDGHPLAKVASVNSESTSRLESPSPTGAPGVDDLIRPDMTDFKRLDSPGMSEEEEEEVEEEEIVKGKRRVAKKAPMEAARRMLEAGEGKYLKAESLVTDDT